MASVVGGLVYFAITYTVGFALGTVRQLILAPALGDTAALLVEMPLILAAAFFAARAVVRRLPDVSSFVDRMIVGCVGFTALLGCEYAMAAILRGWTFQQWLESFGTRTGAISLLMFLIFAVLPLTVRPLPMARGR